MSIGKRRPKFIHLALYPRGNGRVEGHGQTEARRLLLFTVLSFIALLFGLIPHKVSAPEQARRRRWYPGRRLGPARRWAEYLRTAMMKILLGIPPRISCPSVTSASATSRLTAPAESYAFRVRPPLPKGVSEHGEGTAFLRQQGASGVGAREGDETHAPPTAAVTETRFLSLVAETTPAP